MIIAGTSALVSNVHVFKFYAAFSTLAGMYIIFYSASFYPQKAVLWQRQAVNAFSRAKVLSALNVIMNALQSLNVTPVIIEPDELRSLKIWSLRSMIHSRLLRFVVDGLSGQQSLLTLGILEQQSQLLISNNKWPANWRYHYVKQKDTRLIDHRNRSRDRGTEMVAHHWLILNENYVIHLPVIAGRGRDPYNWIPTIQPWTKNPVFMFNTPFEYPVAFLSNFTTIATQIFNRSATVLLPRDVEFFLWQQPYFRFFECNFETSWKFREKTSLDETNKTRSWDARASKAAQKFRDHAYKYRMPVWIVAGTMLGWYRQCGILSYTSDVDFATNITLHNAAFINDTLKNPSVKLGIQFGVLEDGLEYTFGAYPEDVHVDLFFHTKNNFGNGTFMSGSYPDKRQRLRWNYPPFHKGYCSAELLGYIFFVPCNTDEFVFAEFGKDEWFTPTTYFLWFKHHKNLEFGDIYSEEAWKRFGLKRF